MPVHLSHALALSAGAALGGVAGFVGSSRNRAALTRILYPVDAERGIAERGLVEVQGTRLLVHLRGRDRANPPLVYVHGGPDQSVEAMAHLFQAPWEEYFTVAQYDQRGVGGSRQAGDTDAGAEMTVEQHVADLVAVIEHVSQRTGHPKVVLLGHSWGSLLGALVASRRPDLVSVYVGVGQVVSMPGAHEESRRLLLEEAHRRGDVEATSVLAALPEALPADHAGRMAFVRALQRYLRPFAKSMRHVMAGTPTVRLVLEMYLTHPEDTAWSAVQRLLGELRPRGDREARERARAALLDDAMQLDLRADATTFEVPVVLFAGEHDWQVPSGPALAWLEEVDAPHKEVVVFPDSAHVMVFEEPGRFLVELVQRVRSRSAP